MYKQCKTIKTVQRQKEFEKTLLSMMERMDYRDISISALCREMKVQRKTFYRYFDGIEDVLNIMIDEVMQEAFLFLEGTPEIERFFDFWKSKRRFLDILAQHHLSSLLLNRTSERILLLSGETVTIKGLRWISYAAAFVSIVIIWHRGGLLQSAEELADMVRKIYGVN